MDLDGDGIKDVLSGSWPGELFFFKGRGQGAFDAPVKLKGKNGKSINIGGGIQQNDEHELLIAGDATFQDENGKHYILYEGERILLKPNQQAGVTGTASAVCVADLTNDGTPDLVVGTIRGGVYCIVNEGSAKAWSFGQEQPLLAAGAPINVGSRAGPCVADWDGDGKLDLLAGADDGSVTWYRNTGAVDARTKLPLFAAGRVLVPKAAELQYGPSAPIEPTRGVRAKICVADWNGDGRPDLLVGDLSVQRTRLPEPTAQQKAQFEQAQVQLKELQPRYDAAVRKFLDGRTGKGTPAEQEKAQKEFSDLSQQMSTLRAKLPQEYEQHGWVWLFVRKPPG